jgi:large subunit ribosomal protein L7e
LYAGHKTNLTHRSVPTQDQILVPETLLKKRKSQEKARQERSAELEKKKKVRANFISTQGGIGGL